MNGKVLIALTLGFGVLLLGACTKKEVTHTPDGKPLFSKTVGDPEKLIFEAEVNIPKSHKKKVGKSDLLIWILKDGDGQFLAGGITPVPTEFPHKIAVKARNLSKPVAEGSSLIFDSRIVAFGDEGKPPKKGQLQLLVGQASSQKEQPIVKPAVSSKVLEKYMSKRAVSSSKLVVGDKVSAEFKPWLM